LKAWYISDIPGQETLTEESVTFYLFYLFAEELNMSCPLSGLWNDYYNIDSLSLNYIIDRYYEVASDEERDISKEEMLQSLKIAKNIKFKKHKSRQDLEMQLFAQTINKHLRDFIMSDFAVRFEDAGMPFWKDVPRKGGVNIHPYYNADCDETKRNDYYSNLLKKCLDSKNVFMAFNQKVFEGFQMMSFGMPDQKSDNMAVEQAKKPKLFKNGEKWWLKILFIIVISIFIVPYNLFQIIFSSKYRKKVWKWIKYFFSRKYREQVRQSEATAWSDETVYSICLFRIPSSPLLEADKLLMIRSNLRKKMNIISDKLYELKNELASVNYDKEVFFITQEFYLRIEPELKALQKQIDDDIYLQQLVNSNEKSFYFEVHAAVVSVDRITRLHEKNGILQPYAGDALRKNLSMYTDIYKCDVILLPRFEEYA